MAWIDGRSCLPTSQNATAPSPHKPTLADLQASSLALLAFGGRLPQIVSNFRRGGSGELSLTSCLLSVAGNVGRLFTTLMLVDDVLVLAGAVIQLILNGILLAQTTATALELRRGSAVPA